jgi:hypothetical protein
MELSDRERRELQEMETRLLAEDPHLASSLSLGRVRVRVRPVSAVAGLVIGVILMAIGVTRGHAPGIAVALVGYVVLLASVSASADLLRSRRGGTPLLKAAGGPRRAS